jgi:hypothetical protein
MSTTTTRSPTSRTSPPSFDYVFRRVLHAETPAHELRTLLRDEWATISVVAGLFVRLAGGAATSAPLSSEITKGTAGDAAYYVYTFATMAAFMTSAASCIISLFLLHTSNTVPERELHAFLVRVHAILWLPLGGLIASLVFTSVANNAATLVIYDAWSVAGVRIGIAVLWLALLFYSMYAMSHAAMLSAGGPLRAASEERAERPEGPEAGEDELVQARGLAT